MNANNTEETRMSVSRRHALASLIAAALLAMPAAAHAETIRVGLPTKTYWPTTVAETAVRQKLFEKEGITAELTIYRSGRDTYEGVAEVADADRLRMRALERRRHTDPEPS